MRRSWSRFARRCPLQQRPARRRRHPPFSRRPALPRRRASRRPCARRRRRTRGRRTACPTSRRARCGPARGTRSTELSRITSHSCASLDLGVPQTELPVAYQSLRGQHPTKECSSSIAIADLCSALLSKRGRRGTSCRGAPPTRARPQTPEARRRFSAARTTRAACSLTEIGRTSPRALLYHSPSPRRPGARRSPAAIRGSGSGSR